MIYIETGLYQFFASKLLIYNNDKLAADPSFDDAASRCRSRFVVLLEACERQQSVVHTARSARTGKTGVFTEYLWHGDDA